MKLWLETLDWSTEQLVAEYLGLAEPRRRERLERFRRQAASWDLTLEFPVDRPEQPDEERARWREDYERERQRTTEQAAADESRWQDVQDLLEAEHARRELPSSLRECFVLLGLPAKTSLAEARKRYRALAKQHHPDVSGRHDEMKQINDAWEKVATFFLS